MKRWEIGVISDTHGLVRPEALAALRGVDRIVHAGDIGSADVLARLETIAPVTFVVAAYYAHTWTRRGPARWVNTLRQALYEHVQRLSVDFFARRISETNGWKPKEFTAGAVSALEKYAWPGNVCELQPVSRAPSCRPTASSSPTTCRWRSSSPAPRRVR